MHLHRQFCGREYDLLLRRHRRGLEQRRERVFEPSRASSRAGSIEAVEHGFEASRHLPDVGGTAGCHVPWNSNRKSISANLRQAECCTLRKSAWLIRGRVRVRVRRQTRDCLPFLPIEPDVGPAAIVGIRQGQVTGGWKARSRRQESGFEGMTCRR